MQRQPLKVSIIVISRPYSVWPSLTSGAVQESKETNIFTMKLNHELRRNKDLKVEGKCVGLPTSNVSVK